MKIFNRRKGPGERTFRTNKFSTPLKFPSAGGKANAQKGKRIYFNAKHATNKDFVAFSDYVKTQLKVRKTDKIIFRKHNRKYYAQVNSQGYRFYQPFIIKDKKTIETLKKYEKQMKEK